MTVQEEVTHWFKFVHYVNQFEAEGIKFNFWEERKLLTKKDVEVYIELIGNLSKKDKAELYKKHVGKVSDVMDPDEPRINKKVDRQMTQRFYSRLLRESVRNEKHFIEKELEYLNTVPKFIRDEFEAVFYPILELFEDAQKNGGLKKTEHTLNFAVYLNDRGKPLLAYLIKNYTGAKIQDIAMMLFALEKLKLLTDALTNFTQDELAKEVGVSFMPRSKAKQLTRQALNISKYNNNLSAYTAKIDKQANLIEAELQRLTAN